MTLKSDEFDALRKKRLGNMSGDIDPGANAVIMQMVIGAWRAEAALEAAVHRPIDLTWAGFRLLFCLWVSGPAKPGDLAKMLFTTAPTVSSVINTMEKRGYVERRRDHEDRRIVHVRLTRTGERLIDTAFRKQHELEKEWVAGLSKADINAFFRVLNHLTASIQNTQRQNASE